MSISIQKTFSTIQLDRRTIYLLDILNLDKETKSIKILELIIQLNEFQFCRDRDYQAHVKPDLEILLAFYKSNKFPFYLDLNLENMSVKFISKDGQVSTEFPQDWLSQ